MSADVVRGWESAAEVAGRSATSLRKLVEAKKLAAQKDEDGVYVFERASLEALPPAKVLATGQLGEDEAADRREPAPSTAGDKPEPLDGTGELAALVFGDLQNGRELRQIVVERRLAPETVRRAYDQWLSLGEVDAPRKPEAEARLAAAEMSIAELATQLAAIETRVREGAGRAVQHRQALDGRLHALASQPRIHERAGEPAPTPRRASKRSCRNLPAGPFLFGRPEVRVRRIALRVRVPAANCAAGRLAG